MIQASELRLGNWIRLGGMTSETRQTYTPCQVTASLLAAIQEENEERPDAVLSVFMAIPLTPEILEACGFEKRDDGYTVSLWCNDYAIGYAYGKTDKPLLFKRQTPWTAPFGPKEEIKVALSSKHTQYLHQLQNLHFAWTGQELTVNLTSNQSV